MSRYVYKITQNPNFLKKPTNEQHKLRFMEKVKIPYRHFLTEFQVYGNTNFPSVPILKYHFINEGRLEISTALRILNETREIMSTELNILKLENPIVIVGDIHGQFYDLLTAFRLGGSIDNTSYIFLGDYVDRGSFSTEVVLYLFALKINYPNKIWLLRGNHETRHLTSQYTFKRECLIKYNLDVYDTCMNAFDALPLAGLINGSILCIHGGISPTIKTLKDIQNINRFCEPPLIGAMCDLLWSDPTEDFDQLDCFVDRFSWNQKRLCSFVFSFMALRDFLQTNHLITLIRGHEVQMDGFQLSKEYEKTTNLPALITVFSAPNYCNCYGNKGAIIQYQKTKINIKQYIDQPQPYWLPNFENAISITLPFIAEKIINIMVALLKNCIEGGGYNDSEQIDKMSEIKQSIRLYHRFATKLSCSRLNYILQIKKSAGSNEDFENLNSRYAVEANECLIELNNKIFCLPEKKHSVLKSFKNVM